MKIVALLLIASLIVAESVSAQAHRARSSNFEVETKWPGIVFSISRLERIEDNRLLVFVRVVATSRAAASGTFLGTMTEPSERSDRDPPNFKPFSLDSTVMTDEQTQQRYSVLPPVASEGKAYFPGELVNILYPGQGETLTIQFAAPPAPPEEGNSSSKQSVTFLLTGAKGPITRVPLATARSRLRQHHGEPLNGIRWGCLFSVDARVGEPRFGGSHEFASFQLGGESPQAEFAHEL